MSFGSDDGVGDVIDPIFVTFNQDYSSLAVGTKSGYKLFTLSSSDKLELIHEDGTEDISIVERLFSSSLVAIVSFSHPRKLKVCHFKRKTEICNYSYPNTILAVKLNRQRLVVCLEESIYIHNIRDMKLLHTIRDTPANASGLCALSANSDHCYLAYPANATNGEVHIFDAQALQSKINIAAHDNPLAAVAFDSIGSKIATASEKGTVIRVFQVEDGQVLYEFRRGYARCVSIYSLSFSADALFLCASSNTETVHIFKLEDLNEERPLEEPQGWMGYLSQCGKKALAQSASYLPSVADMMNQWRSFATARLPLSGSKNVCAVINIAKVTRVLIASSDGYLYIYDLNLIEGGDCTLIKQHRLDEINTSTGQSGGDASGSMNYAAALRVGVYEADNILPGSLNVASAALTDPLSSTPILPSEVEQVHHLKTTSSPPSSQPASGEDYDGEFPPIFQ